MNDEQILMCNEIVDDYTQILSIAQLILCRDNKEFDTQFLNADKEPDYLRFIISDKVSLIVHDPLFCSPETYRQIHHDKTVPCISIWFQLDVVDEEISDDICIDLSLEPDRLGVFFGIDEDTAKIYEFEEEYWKIKYFVSELRKMFHDKIDSNIDDTD